MSDDKAFQGYRWTQGNNNLRFKVTKIKFFEEDVKKMEGMTSREELDYTNQLKKEGKYIIVDE